MADVAPVTYNGQAQGPNVVYDGKTLREGVDYTWTSLDGEPRMPGDYNVVLFGKGDFARIANAVHIIEPASIQDAEVVLSHTSFTYNGQACIPEVRTIGGKALAEGTDYTVQILDGNGVETTYIQVLERLGILPRRHVHGRRRPHLHRRMGTECKRCRNEGHAQQHA